LREWGEGSPEIAGAGVTVEEAFKLGRRAVMGDREVTVYWSTT
jgi:hypothetical protein